MDLASIGLSAALSALLFVALEFTIIIPLFRRVVTKAVNEMVEQSLIPSIKSYVNSQIEELTTILTKSLYQKITGFVGGRKKGVNAIMERLAAGESMEDIEDDYQPSTIDKVYDIISAAIPYLPDPSILKERLSNGSKKEKVREDENKNSIQGGAAQAFVPQEIKL